MSKKDNYRNRNWIGHFPKTPGRLIGMGLIRIYQLTFSNLIGNSCRHLPTCSEYAYEAIARYGLWIGGWLSLFRILKCGPFGSHGFCPVPQNIQKPIQWRMLLCGRKKK
ncbi:membrane protein insertion efficiency factor YidD [Liberibacter crescens]|uniref:membrane protein insertion efficiency factor YidD n=1 Tax=Liberibacter crescens TaxID=1273132 RepID=UPI0006881ABD|nr:membrane protein insertion efficiency factor YidD [Liberibacter crescens]